MKALRKPLSLFMAMLMCLGIFAGTGTTAFAATEEVGTITFTGTYDSNGNRMYYNTSAVINGNTVGGAGHAKNRMYVDGDTAYCMVAQIFNNLKKKKPSRTGGWVHIYNSNSFLD